MRIMTGPEKRKIGERERGRLHREDQNARRDGGCSKERTEWNSELTGEPKGYRQNREKIRCQSARGYPMCIHRLEQGGPQAQQFKA